MADKRAFFKTDVGYFMNPKVATIRVESPTAIIMHLSSVAYSAQHLTDGVVPVDLIRALSGGSSDDVARLIGGDLWHASGHACEVCPQPPDGSVYVHDFLEHNRSSTDAKEQTAKGKKAAIARWRDAKRNASGMQDALPNAMPNPMPNPMPREKERERTTTSTLPSGFDAFWGVYPKRVSKQDAVKKYAAALKLVDAQTLLDAAKRYAASREGEPAQYTKNPSTWLNQGCWEDEPVTKPQAPRQLGDDIWDRKGDEQ